MLTSGWLILVPIAASIVAGISTLFGP